MKHNVPVICLTAELLMMTVVLISIISLPVIPACILCVISFLFLIAGSIYLWKKMQMTEKEQNQKIQTLTSQAEEAVNELQTEKYRLSDSIRLLSDFMSQSLSEICRLAKQIPKEDKQSVSSKEAPVKPRSPHTIPLSRQITLQAGQIQGTLDSVQMLSKLDAGTASFQSIPVNGKIIVLSALEPFLLTIDQKQIKLQVKIAGNVSITGDKKWLQTAFRNLIQNALDHCTLENRLLIRGTQTETEALIQVFNDGETIPANELPYIFERFYSGSDSDQTPHVGIGLALAKEVIEAHHGTLLVESEEGKGTCFTAKFLLSEIPAN